MNIELTEQEANTLLVMIDESVKVKGLLHARAGVYFEDKIKEAFKKAREVVEEQK